MDSPPLQLRLLHWMIQASILEAGSRMLRDPIRCSLQMLRQIKAGVKLSVGVILLQFPGTNRQVTV